MKHPNPSPSALTRTLMAAAVATLVAPTFGCDRTRVIEKEVERIKTVKVPTEDSQRIRVTLWDTDREKALEALEASVSRLQSLKAVLTSKPKSSGPEGFTFTGQREAQEALEIQIQTAQHSIDDLLKTLGIRQLEDLTRGALEIESLKIPSASDSGLPTESLYQRRQALRLASLIAERDRTPRLLEDLGTLKNSDSAEGRDLGAGSLVIFSEILDVPIEAIERVLAFSLPVR